MDMRSSLYTLPQRMQISLAALATAMYAGEKILQQRVDEEGCGAVMATLKVELWNDLRRHSDDN